MNAAPVGVQPLPHKELDECSKVVLPRSQQMDAVVITEQPTHPGGEWMGKGRIEAVSDGIFAIVLTLLVLEIKVPHLLDHNSLSEMATALVKILPKFVSWVISFVTLCVIWLNHHRLFALIRTVDHGLFWWNANLLLWISFIPFPTSLLGDYPHNKLAVSVYGAAMLLMGMGFVLFRWYLQCRPHLLLEHVNFVTFRRGTRLTLLFGPVVYFVAMLLSWVNPLLAFICYGGVSLYFVFPRAAYPKIV